MKISTMGVLGDIHTRINISELYAAGLFYNTSKSQAQGYIKINGKITACVYKSGKIQIYGIKNTDDVPEIWNQVLDILRTAVDVTEADKTPKIKFIVASENLSTSLFLQDIAKRFTEENIDYEPEQFPGLIWKTDLGTVLLFSTGNIIITGPNTVDKINETIRYIKNKLGIN